MMWRVWPERRRNENYYRVHLFDTRQEMRVRLRYDFGRGRNFDKTEAFCSSLDVFELREGHWRRTPYCGDVYFHRQCLGSGIVAHELPPAAQWYVQRKYRWQPDHGIRPGKRRPNDERLADAAGELVACFWPNYFRRV